MCSEERIALLTCHQTWARRGAGPRSQGADLPAQRAQARQRVPEVEAQADLELAAQNPAGREAEALQSLKAVEALVDLCRDQGQGPAQAAEAGVDQGA